MKKRFKNILIRNRKKNGISILVCAAVLSITLGMLVGCSVTKENTENKTIENETIENKTIENEDAADQVLGNASELDAAQTDPLSVDNPSADHQTLENTMTFLNNIKILIIRDIF